mgnify:CR=1 FL=1
MKIYKKVLLNLLIVFLLIQIIGLNKAQAWWVDPSTLDTDAFTNGNPYAPYYPGSAGNCTWYVWGRAHQKLGISLPGWGNAGTWADSAQGKYTVDYNPTADSIAVWPCSYYVDQWGYDLSAGHVAYVERVNGDRMDISEGNWAGQRYSEREISTTDTRGYAGKPKFIHLKEEPKLDLDLTVQDLGYDFLAYIVPKDNHNLVISSGTGTENGTNVAVESMQGKLEQKWRFKRQGDGSYYISNFKTKLGLDVYGSGNINKENIQVWNGGQGGDKQSWFIYRYNGGYRLTPRSSPDRIMAMDIDTNIQQGANVHLYNTFNTNNPNQTFDIIFDTYKPEGEIQNLGSKFVAQIVPKYTTNVAVEAVGSKNGDNVYIQTRDENSDAQKWEFTRYSDGSYKIINLKTKKALDIDKTGNKNSENIYVWTPKEDNKQKWFIYPYNGGYRLVPKSSAKDLRALDIAGESLPGHNVQLYECVSDTNKSQTFSIEKINQYELGDIDGDGKINARDAKLVMQHFTKKIILTEEQQERAEVSGDGKINARDAKLIMQYFTKKIDKFPVE